MRIPARRCALLALLLPIAAACSPSSARVGSGAEPRAFLRFAEERAPDHPSVQACRELVRLAAADSGGALQLRVYDSGKLGDEASVVEQLRFGGIDLARVSVRALEEVSPTAARVARPGSFPSRSAMAEFMEGAGGAALAEELLSERLVLLAWYDGGPELRLLPRGTEQAGFAGLRVGMERSKAAVGLVEGEGGTPVTLALGDFRASLEEGFAEAFLTTLVTAASQRLLEELRAEPLEESRVLELVVAGRPTFAKLAAADQRIIRRAASDSAVLHGDFLAFAEERARSELAARGLR